jgi:cobalt/nickel transport protein
MNALTRKAFLGLCVMAMLSPLGIMLPEWFGAGDAWGEWDTQTIKEHVGYIPKGMQNNAQLYHAPAPDYTTSVPFLKKTWIQYFFCGIAGIGIIGLLTFGVSSFYKKKHEQTNP